MPMVEAVLEDTMNDEYKDKGDTELMERILSGTSFALWASTPPGDVPAGRGSDAVTTAAAAPTRLVDGALTTRSAPPGKLGQTRQTCPGSAGSLLPPEVLLLIVQSLIPWSVPDRWGSGPAFDHWQATNFTRELANLVLVCRAWSGLLAPYLYSKVRVPETHLPGSRLFPPTRIGQYARMLHVRSGRALEITATLSHAMHRIIHLVWSSGDLPTAHRAVCHRTNFRVQCYALESSFANVVQLGLDRQHFLSSSDLLFLLGSLPSLECVKLNCVTVDRVSVTSRIPRCSRLSRIIYRDCDVKLISSLLAMALWPHPAPDESCCRFLGLDHRDLLTIMNLSQLLRDNGAIHQMSLRPCSDKQTWVVLLSQSPEWAILLYADSAGAARARINDVLIYCLGEPLVDAPFVEGKSAGRKLGECLSRLPALRSLVLDGTLRDDRDDPFVEDLISSPLDTHKIFRSAGRGTYYSARRDVVHPGQGTIPAEIIERGDSYPELWSHDLYQVLMLDP